MMDRHDKLMLMKDLLDRMSDSCSDWQGADEHFAHYFEESMRRDLAELRRLCESIRAERHVTCEYSVSVA